MDLETNSTTETCAAEISTVKSALTEREENMAEINALKLTLTERDETIAELKMSLTKLKEEMESREARRSEHKEALDTTVAASNAVIKKLLHEKELLRRQVRVQKLENSTLTMTLQKQKLTIFTMESLKKNDDLLLYYTGISSYQLFLALLNYLVPDRDASCIKYDNVSRKYLPLEDQLLMVLSKLRRNLGHRDLAFRFGKSASGITRLFKTWINYMYLRLGSLSLWPHRDILIANSPSDFLEAFPNVIVIIDGTEIYTEKPSDLRLQSQMYSNYKSHNTLKGLIGVDQRGGIIFISQLMDGSISDKEIVKESGFIDIIKQKLDTGELLASDQVMADKGFPVGVLSNDMGISLIIPPFASSAQQMCAADVIATKKIAQFRINVERAMARIKKFKILSNIVPMSILGSINQIWTVSYILANLQAPLK